MFRKMKEYAGVLLKDSGRYRRAFRSSERAANGDPLWVRLCNRPETLVPNPKGPGVNCPWRWTSDLHACSVKLEYAVQLAKCAFGDWPVSFSEESPRSGQPEVSFIIAHEGNQRIDHVVWTVRSILAQRDAAVECLIVDQSAETSFGTRLPAAVQHLHRPRPQGLSGWRKSWAFNQGARQAKGRILVFHDGDIVCPTGYATALINHMQGYGAASIQRFLFNLNENETRQVFTSLQWPRQLQPDRVRQNWEGGTIAVKRDAFFELGGYDEAFVGWGGEDNEFFDRCAAVNHLRFGFVPFVHLWHPAQSDKHIADNRNITHALDARIAIPVERRIAQLRERNFGDTQKPDPPKGYRDESSLEPVT